MIRFRSLLLLLLLTVLGCSSGPEDTYEEVTDAVADGNWLRFEHLVDVGGMIEHYVDTWVTWDHERMERDFGFSASPEETEAIKARLEGQLTGSFRDSFDQGALPFPSLIEQSYRTLDSVSVVRTEEPVVEGERALIPLLLTGVASDSLVRVDLMAERRGGGWVFTHLDRVRPILQFLHEHPRPEEARIEDALQERGAPVQGSEWISYDEATHRVTLELAAGDDETANYWNFNGYTEGEVTVVVPLGAQVVINFENWDHNLMAHSVGVAPFTRSPPVTPSPTPVFPRAISSNPTDLVDATGVGERETIAFTAERTGRYILLCYVPGHAVAGQWIGFEVSATGEVGVRAP